MLFADFLLLVPSKEPLLVGQGNGGELMDGDFYNNLYDDLPALIS
jgi:hypothetical protein